jgi:release factor glutamine methyltransferase
MKETWTPLKVIQWAVPLLRQKQVLHPRYSAVCLTALGLGMDPLNLHLQFDRVLKNSEFRRIRGYIRRRLDHEPLEYILGEVFFFGFPFKVSPAVLRPRPETGQLVELALDVLAKIPEQRRLVLDLGTGCGNIAISIAKYVPCRVWAVDISQKALAVAKTNARRLNVASNIQWRRGDWFSGLNMRDPRRFQVILCNPPYIAQLEKKVLNPEITGFEPPVAVFGGKTGLEPYQAIARGLKKRLTPGGVAFMELEPCRANLISAFFKSRDLKRSFGKDDAGVNRVLILEN